MGHVLALHLVCFDPVDDAGGGWAQLRKLALGVLCLVVAKKDPYWAANKAELLRDRVANKVLEVVRHKALPVNVEEEGGRARLNLHKVAHFEHFTTLSWHPLYLLKGVHPLIQEACGDASVPLFVDAKHLVHDAALPLASLS